MGLMKFRSIFRKEAYVSAFLISKSNLFHSFITYDRKEFLIDTVRQNSLKIQMLLCNSL